MGAFGITECARSGTVRGREMLRRSMLPIAGRALVRSVHTDVPAMAALPTFVFDASSEVCPHVTAAAATLRSTIDSYGENHPRTVSNLVSLASTLSSVGREHESAMLRDQAAQLRQQVFGR